MAEKQISQENDEVGRKKEYNGAISRQEVEAAIAKAVELRATHASLLQGINNSPANLMKCPNSSSSPANLFSAQDYPIFTPSYEAAPLPGSKQLLQDTRDYTDLWDDYGLGGVGNCDEASFSNYTKANSSLRKGGISPHICPADDQRSVTSSCAGQTQITLLRTTSPGGDYSISRRNSMGDLRSFSSCNRCKPAIVSTRSSNVIVPLTDSHSLNQLHPKSKGMNLSWLFPKLKKKNKNENSWREFEDISSVETLKKELVEAKERRESALMEAAEMKSSLGELKQKLEYLETYCEELKKALKQANVQAKDNSLVFNKLIDLPRGENTIPVSEEVMVEGFLQIVSESRLSVKQFCKTLIAQVEETDNSLTDNLNLLLQPYKLSLNSKLSKAVLYHVEAIINQSLFQDFENVVFQKNGAPKHLDPQQDCNDQFSSFVSLRNLSWNEVLRKGTKYYSEDFSKFCDQKMCCIITTLNWRRPWPEQLLQAFFVATKCIWLLHLLAFSFDPPLGILRVEENTTFDNNYMEDVFADKQKTQGLVKIMVMPGFYVRDKVHRCKVICRHKSAT
ncbi:IRK-interacting protein-like [Lycium barbarum]|uniref:IRK-interacting protein-like n=1 Tax=Lycium barbarum TaxID=112863 RepID=UPI00293E325A|nr:IRK-interacting protein-like [Lycium barbarum]